MHHLTAAGALGTKAAPFWGPIMVSQGLWHGTVMTTSTELQGRVVGNFCLLLAQSH